MGSLTLGGVEDCRIERFVRKGKQNLKSFSSDFGHLLVQKRTEFEVN